MARPRAVAEAAEHRPAALEVAPQALVVERREHAPIAGDQYLAVELGLEVERDLDVVAARLVEQAPLAFETGVEVSAAQGGEQADHRDGDARLLDESDLGVEDLRPVAVEAEDETAGDLDALALDGGDGVKEVVVVSALGVLELVCPAQRLGVGAFDAEKGHREAGRNHGIEHRLEPCQVDARLGVQVERVAALALPVGERVQQAQGFLLVADEVVVDQENGAAPAERVEAVKLGEHLRVGLCARDASEQLRDVAEFAVEWAAARELKRHRGVGVEVQQLEARHRGGDDRRFALGVVDPRGPARLPVREEAGEGLLDLVEQVVVGASDLVGEGGRMRPTDRHRSAARVAARDDVAQRTPLHDHGRGQHQVGPVKVLVGQRRDVHVHQAQLVVGGEHRRHREQAERWHRGALSD